MRNSYEVGDIAELGRAGDLILGAKYADIFFIDWLLGWGFWTEPTQDIDESDE